MKKLLLVAGFGILTAAGLSAYLLGVFEPALTTNYALEKALHRDSAPRRILWHPISIEAAYQAVGRRRTDFAPERAQMPGHEKAYLISLLSLTDAALAERVAIQAWLQGGGEAGQRDSNYEAILESIKGLPSPERMIPAEALIYHAIDEQRRYLEGRRGPGPPVVNPDHPLVLSSHEKLSAARRALLDVLDKESIYNRRALSDHLTALDFR